MARAPGQGRKRKPNEQKVLSGSKHANLNTIDFDKVTNIDPPEWMEGEALKKWLQICPELCKKKILAVTDIQNLEVYCSAYGDWHAAREEVENRGVLIGTVTGDLKKNPAVTAKTEAARVMSSYGAMLGLDPSSRGRLVGVTGSTRENEFADF